MEDYQIEEMMRMYHNAKAQLNGDCPLLEDEVFVAMVNHIYKLSNELKEANARIIELLEQE